MHRRISAYIVDRSASKSTSLNSHLVLNSVMYFRSISTAFDAHYHFLGFLIFHVDSRSRFSFYHAVRLESNRVEVIRSIRKRWNHTSGLLLLITGFVLFFRPKIQGLFKDFQGPNFEISRTSFLFTSKNLSMEIVWQYNSCSFSVTKMRENNAKAPVTILDPTARRVCNDDLNGWLFLLKLCGSEKIQGLSRTRNEEQKFSRTFKALKMYSQNSRVFKGFQDAYEPCYQRKNVWYCREGISTNFIDRHESRFKFNVSCRTYSVLPNRRREEFANIPNFMSKPEEDWIVSQCVAHTSFPTFQCSTRKIIQLDTKFFFRHAIKV